MDYRIIDDRPAYVMWILAPCACSKLEEPPPSPENPKAAEVAKHAEMLRNVIAAINTTVGEPRNLKKKG